MTNHEFILDLLKDGKRHCSDEIPFRDYRARVGELRRGKNKWHQSFNIQGVECKGQCGRTHKSPVYILWMENSDLPMNPIVVEKAIQLANKAQRGTVERSQDKQEPPAQEIPPKTTQTTTKTGYAYQKPVKTFMEAFEEERKRKGAPLSKAEMNLLAKKYK